MKRFLISRSIESASGNQVFWVDAENEADALARHAQGEGDIYTSECEVTGLGEPEVTGETTLDDTGE